MTSFGASSTERNRHQPIRQQHAHLSATLRGHYGYYGITGNGRRIRWYLHQVERVWKKWLSRRGRHGTSDGTAARSAEPASFAACSDHSQYAVPSEALP